MADILVTNLTNVDGIRKKHVERTTEKRVPAELPTVLCDPDFGSDATGFAIFPSFALAKTRRIAKGGASFHLILIPGRAAPLD